MKTFTINWAVTFPELSFACRVRNTPNRVFGGKVAEMYQGPSNSEDLDPIQVLGFDLKDQKDSSLNDIQNALRLAIIDAGTDLSL